MSSVQPFNWVCPFCRHASVINEARFSSSSHNFNSGNKYGGRALLTKVIVCANPQCGEFTLTCRLVEQAYNGQRYLYGDVLQKWSLIPMSEAKPLPDYLPVAILSDYGEACLIRDLSPKASATLARRCLQGMIRDFWTAKAGRLVDEIESIRDKVDSETWDAIDGVRSIGNIGAHMEADINVIVDVDPDEAKLLIELIETLVDDWYVTRHDRKQRMSGVKAIAAEKKAQKKGNGGQGGVTPA